jgi:hypothetical protein
MINIKTVKTVVGVVVSIGVGAIVDNAIKATTPSNTKGLKKLAVWVGGIVLSGMVTEAAIKYGEEKIDSAFTGVKKMVEEEKQEENKEKAEI